MSSPAPRRLLDRIDASLVASVLAQALAAVVVLRLLGVYYREIRTRGFDEWRMGDWLINDAGGFVRRGALGQAFLWLGDHTPAPQPGATWGWVFAVQALAYLLFFGLAARLVARARAYRPIFFLFFSPAFLLFPYLCWMGAFRKESLHLALFAVGCHAVATGARRAAWPLAVVIAALMPLLVLSHEMLFAMVPYYLALGAHLLQPWGRRAMLAWGATLVGLTSAALALALTHKGGPETPALVCSALTARGFPESMCSGAVAWLAYPVAKCHADVVAMLAEPGVVPLTVLAFVLVFAPVAWVCRDLARDPRTAPHVRRAAGAATASSLLMVPIAWAALDWGRLLHVQLATVTLLLMALVASGGVRSPAPAHRGRLAAFAVGLTLFATTWSLQHYDRLVAWGIAARLVRALHL